MTKAHRQNENFSIKDYRTRLWNSFDNNHWQSIIIGLIKHLQHFFLAKFGHLFLLS